MSLTQKYGVIYGIGTTATLLSFIGGVLAFAFVTPIALPGGVLGAIVGSVTAIVAEKRLIALRVLSAKGVSEKELASISKVDLEEVKIIRAEHGLTPDERCKDTEAYQSEYLHRPCSGEHANPLKSAKEMKQENER